MKVSYDIRGKYPEEINESFIMEILNFLLKKSEKGVVLAYDSRESSKKIVNYLLKNKEYLNGKILFLGESTTPLASFAGFLYGTYSIMITASHLGEEYNGLKISENGFAWEKEKYLELLENLKLNQKLERSHNFEIIDIREEVLKEYGKNWLDFKTKEISVVKNSAENPGKKILKELGFKEVENKLAFEFDSDADRVYVIKNNNYLHKDLLGIILAKHLTNRGDNVIFNVGCSVLVYDELKDRDLEMVRTGRNYMIQAMNGAKFGFEYSGHYYFFNENLNYYLDDGIKALIEFHRIGLDKVIEEYERLISKTNLSEEYRLKGKIENFHALIEIIREKSFRVIDIDGYRFEFGNKENIEGFFLIRQSNTEDKVSIRFEHRNRKEFEEIKNIVENFIREIRN